MDRITDKMLDSMAGIINRMTGNPETTWARTDAGNVASVGNYHISGAYGGVSLHQIANEGGGIRDVFSCGHQPKRDLYNRMRAYIEGLRDAKQD